MVERKQIYGNIYIQPDEIVNNIHELIEFKIKNKYEKTCNNEYGFILKIESVDKNFKNLINTIGNGEILFEVYFICLVLKPQKGITLSGKIFMIFRHGIFTNIDKIKILIPESKLNNWIFDKDHFIKDGKTLKIGDVIPIVISDVRYEKKNFSCIGTLYEN